MTATAVFADTLQRQGYPADIAAARARTFYMHLADEQRERPERYSMDFAPPHERQQARQRFTGTDGATLEPSAPTTTREPTDEDKAAFWYLVKSRGMGHLAALPPGQTFPELPHDYSATSEDTTIFNKLLRHYGMDHHARQQPASASTSVPQPPLPGTPSTNLPTDPLSRQQGAHVPTGTAPEFTKDDMDRAHAYQIEHPGTTYDEAKAATRNCAGVPNYTANDFRKMAQRDATPLTKDDMDRAHKYQAEHPGVSYLDACLATARETPQRYALERSGTHVIDPGDTYTGTAAGALNWMSSRTDAHRARLQAQKAERKRMYDLAERHGIPVAVAGQAMEMADDGNMTVEAAINMLIDRERNRNLFGTASTPSFSITTTMK